ncbi:MAG: hypothetical protein JXM72_07370 [Deltaproteobacteria bacterium]|nr:hypothetical protein [Deltaproteobacteria bacterium]
MGLLIRLDSIAEHDPDLVGGKAYALGTMLARGHRVPMGLCVTTQAYDTYVRSAGLFERISMELNRKDFSEMRWEEMWDVSLRIRNMFLNTPMPVYLVEQLKGPLEETFGSRPVAVRSSAPGEDSAKVTFAGIHETYMNVSGVYSILEHIRLVWASLWADGALLYRQEMGLDAETSSMAVLIQELINGETSGVVFGMNPNDEAQVVIETVYGLNQGLVDGTVEPDQWILDRASGKILSHKTVKREHMVVPSSAGTQIQDLSAQKQNTPPLDDDGVRQVYDLVMQAQEVFGCPQDVEWTFLQGNLFLLQSRAVTTLHQARSPDNRSWYLTLRRSFGNLKNLKEKIEGELVPEMREVAEVLSRKDCTNIADDELGDELLKRSAIYRSWEKRYWRYFIPFAHGMRLFGQVYNDTVRPLDPFEFMDLLVTSDLLSINRNNMLERIAALVRKESRLQSALKNGEDTSWSVEFNGLIDEFIETFGDLSCGAAECSYDRDSIKHVVREMAIRPTAKVFGNHYDVEKLTEDFLSLFPGEKSGFAAGILDIARASYRLRDDDNIYLGRIRRQMIIAQEEAKRRLEKRGMTIKGLLSDQDLARALKDPGFVLHPKEGPEEPAGIRHIRLKARQLTGQPASRGIVSGIARVIMTDDDLLRFKAGEVLVCDALDPNMTFIVPLAIGIVERRGGMLVHGAIIAREYGLPCVTGVPDATELIQTGNQITVDGYLGIVIIA